MFTFYWDDQLRDDWQYFLASMFQHIVDSLTSKELVRVVSLTEPIKEQRKIVMIV